MNDAVDALTVRSPFGTKRIPIPQIFPCPIGSIASLVQLLGNEAAFALVEHHGGTSIYVPSGRTSDVLQLSYLIGDEGIEKLAKEYGGGWRAKVPLGRDWRIAIYRLSGLTYTQIAAALCVDENTVQRSLKLQGLTNRNCPKQRWHFAGTEGCHDNE